MTETTNFDRAIAHEVRSQCLCFAAQKAARELARRFDRLFAPLGLTNQQYSMMMGIGGMGAPKLGELAAFLVMDHATVTAAVGKLKKRGLVTLRADDEDRRARHAALTAEGVALLGKAVPLWRKEHADLDAEIGEDAARAVYRGMGLLAPSAAPEARSRASASGAR